MSHDQEGEQAAVTGNQLIPFPDGLIEIRCVKHHGEWYYSVLDIIQYTTDSSDPKQYWKKMRQRATSEGFAETLAQVVKLPLRAKDRRLHETDCANRVTVLRLLQSIHSPKVEPVKLWLASVGDRALEELDEAVSDVQRVEEGYRQRGFDERWIQTRLRVLVIRNELTETWKERGAVEGMEFAVLSNTLHTHAFGLSIKAHKAMKKLRPHHDLRDNMQIGELGVLAYTEATAITLHDARGSFGFDELQRDASDAGEAGAAARRYAEELTGQPVVSPMNNLQLTTRGAKQAINGSDHPLPPASQPAGGDEQKQQGGQLTLFDPPPEEEH